MLVYRNEDDIWFGQRLVTATGQLEGLIIGQWATDAGWTDVAAARVSRKPVRIASQFTDPSTSTTMYGVAIYAHRAGTLVTVEGRVDFLPVSGAMHTVIVHYSVPATGYLRDFTFTAFSGKVSFATWRFEFYGHIGNDTYRTITPLGPSIALGSAGSDALDAKNNFVIDTLYGEDGVDLLWCDANDTCVEETPS